jgi:hypothetical protein
MEEIIDNRASQLVNCVNAINLDSHAADVAKIGSNVQKLATTTTEMDSQTFVSAYVPLFFHN